MALSLCALAVKAGAASVLQPAACRKAAARCAGPWPPALSTQSLRLSETPTLEGATAGNAIALLWVPTSPTANLPCRS